MATTNATGTKQGTTLTYDPYGQTLAAAADNSTGNLDYGWLGQHQRPLEHETAALATIEMGARQYAPGLGRFIQADPIEGGSCNDYDYVCGDPINNHDLSGEFLVAIPVVVVVVAAVTAVVASQPLRTRRSALNTRASAIPDEHQPLILEAREHTKNARNSTEERHQNPNR